MKEYILEARMISKKFIQNKNEIKILDKINFYIKKGEKLAIVGSSGSGKSTLLHILGGLEKPSSGYVSILGKKLSKLTEKQLCYIRNNFIGFVYQFHHLLPEFSVIENVALPLKIRRMTKNFSNKEAKQIIDYIGLSHRIHHYPSELSGGERQRVAIARALVTKPMCILADEPTGNLDKSISDIIFDMILELSNKIKTSFIIVTHDLDLAQKCDRILKIQNGSLKTIKDISL